AGTLLDEFHLDFLALELRLAEAALEHLAGQAAVLLAELDVDPVAAAVHHAGFAPGAGRGSHAEQQCQSKSTHVLVPGDFCGDSSMAVGARQGPSSPRPGCPSC